MRRNASGQFESIKKVHVSDPRIPDYMEIITATGTATILDPRGKKKKREGKC